MPQSTAQPGFVLYNADNPYFADIIDTIVRSDMEVTAGIVVTEPKVDLSGIPIVLNPEDVSPMLLEHPALFAHIVPSARHNLVSQATNLGFRRFPELIDPTAVVAHSSELSKGCYVNALAVVAGQCELAQFVFVGRSASIGHHTRLEEFCTVGPGVTIASLCHIGRGTMIGAGATILPRLTIGENSVIGAGAVVTMDVPDKTMVAGNPAKVIREDIEGFKDAGI